MNILIISYYFPPFNSVGAVRVGKAAKYLFRMGNDVRVISCSQQYYFKNQALEIPEKNVIYASMLNVNSPVQLLLGGQKKIAARGFSGGYKKAPSIMNVLGKFYKNLINFPDGQVGWRSYAIKAGLKLIDEWKPDIIVASSPPPTALMVASSLSRQTGIPWVGDFRDLWMENQFLDRPVWRKFLEGRLESSVVSSAAGVITVSDPLAETLKRKFGLPTAVITNGFDSDDYPEERSLRPCEKLNIIYTGMVYDKYQASPALLLRALELLGEEAENIHIHFYGRDLNLVRQLIEKHNVERFVSVHQPVGYAESVRIQCEADILLFLLWDANREQGWFSSKLFEYIGARRPVLALGDSGGVAARLIIERKLGFILSEPEQIAGQLSQWIKMKTQGGIKYLPDQPIKSLTREAQASQMETFLKSILSGSADS